jgi:hypothetical protein
LGGGDIVQAQIWGNKVGAEEPLVGGKTPPSLPDSCAIGGEAALESVTAAVDEG